jgi:hypothetical protein
MAIVSPTNKGCSQVVVLVVVVENEEEEEAEDTEKGDPWGGAIVLKPKE